MKYELYGQLHKIAKQVLRKTSRKHPYRMIDMDNEGIEYLNQASKDYYINELSSVKEKIALSDVYPKENIIPSSLQGSFKDSFVQQKHCSERLLGCKKEEAVNLWMQFVKNSSIPRAYRNGSLGYAGYILDCDAWCLPSWIWTNAAIVKMYCKLGMIKEATLITEKLVALQTANGGWVVRNDYDSNGVVPVLAPNDSAYIANNACIEMYLQTSEKKYLDAANKCAEWIMETARPDGMIYVGYDTKREHWQKNHNIVDVGFTAGLFARLFEITKQQKYYDFLERFVERYIDLFYDDKVHGFSTSLDGNDKAFGGMFGRGQAWALEGLIPASRVLKKNTNITRVIEQTIDTLILKQDKKGAWPYNLSRPLMGLDCKATSVIACSLMEWYKIHPEKNDIKEAANRAYYWCIRHTSTDIKSKGGIFSYSTEGAIVHHFYTWTAFVYGSTYAIELSEMLLKE